VNCTKYDTALFTSEATWHDIKKFTSSYTTIIIAENTRVFKLVARSVLREFTRFCAPELPSEAAKRFYRVVIARVSSMSATVGHGSSFARRAAHTHHVSRSRQVTARAEISAGDKVPYLPRLLPYVIRVSSRASCGPDVPVLLTRYGLIRDPGEN
jgi:hypothetical protein